MLTNMCSTCRAYETGGWADSLTSQLGAVAQLEERVTGSHEVVGSSPISSTHSHGFMLGGLVAGEGCFTTSRRLPSFADGQPRLRFKFSVEMASRDRQLLEQLRDFFGRGSIHDTPARPAELAAHEHLPHRLNCRSPRRDHPFGEAYLLDCAKRRQFEEWKEALRKYEDENIRRSRRVRSRCSMVGCDKPVRGRGLCRQHYYRATGY